MKTQWISKLTIIILLVLSPQAESKTSNEFVTEEALESVFKVSTYEPLKLEKVIDGDTILASGKKIRLWGIDAPEKGEPLYEISTKAIELFIEGAELKCKFIELDKYKREVMQCLIGDKDLGGLMVSVGFAKDFTKYSGGFYKPEERFAKEAKLGIWK